MRLRGCVNVSKGCQRISGGVSRKLLTNIRSHTIGFLYYLMAVLVAISIPIFTSQLEKSRESTDASNIRAAYAELISDALLDDRVSASRTVKLIQTQDSWQNDGLSGTIATGYSGSDVEVSEVGAPKAAGSCTISYYPASGTNSAKVTFTFS